MSPVTLHPVSAVDFDDFTDAFNLAYSDYFVPISMTPSSFRALMQRDDLMPDESVAAVDEGDIIGTGLLGIRDSLGWIGGMGVIPSRRRQGLGRHMMLYLFERGRHLDRINLEVIEANTGAHALYLELGFQHQRYLLILERKPIPAPPAPVSVTVQEQPPAQALTHYTTFHDVPNCWQRGLSSLKGLIPHVQSWVAMDQDQLVGYAVGWANEYEIRLVDIATHPDCDRIGVAQAILTHLHQENPDAHGSSYNIAENDPVLPAFEALGYNTAFRQIEMAYTP